MAEFHDYLSGLAVNGLISGSGQLETALRFELSFAEVEAAILELGLCPARYQRNRQTLSGANQLALLRSTVTVIGCGGLGGYIIEQLARLGVGRIVAIDPDVFEEHNLNRQIFATQLNLGAPKVTAAAARVKEINPVVDVVPHRTAFGAANGRELLEGSTVVVDALDNLETRYQVVQICKELGLPLVHGAIAGWYGQVATQNLGDDIAPYLAGTGAGGKGVESTLGNPAFTPATVASLQVAEVCKVITGHGQAAGGRLLVCNLLDMEFEEIRL